MMAGKIHPGENGTVHFNIRDDESGGDLEECWEVTWIDALEMGPILSAAAIVSARWIECPMEMIEEKHNEAIRHAHEHLRGALGDD